MLPDLRIVIAAVVSTFIFTVGVGFFASSRLIHEQMTARIDTKGLDDTPINRIALNWPEPTKTDRNVDLDFAVTARGSRNPVRDVTSDAEQVAQTPRPNVVPAAPEPTIPVESKQVTREPEAPVSIIKAPDQVEDTSADSVAAPEPTTDTHVVVRPGDVLPVESTGSIPSPAPDTPELPTPEPRLKFAARPENSEPEKPAKRVLAEPAKPAPALKKPPRKAAAKPRPAPRNQPIPAQQVQPFDFFGLFRAPPAAFRLPAQVSTPITPVQ